MVGGAKNCCMLDCEVVAFVSVGFGGGPVAKFEENVARRFQTP